MGEIDRGILLFEIGSIWDLQYILIRLCPLRTLRMFWSQMAVRVGEQANLRDTLLAHAQVWNGTIDTIFDGLPEFTNNGSGYISERTGIPNVSTGFWIPDRDLTRNDRAYLYDYRQLTYVGAAPPLDRVPAGTLTRVSLARWWRPQDADPDFEERCYLQLSGWYL